METLVFDRRKIEVEVFVGKSVLDRRKIEVEVLVETSVLSHLISIKVFFYKMSICMYAAIEIKLIYRFYQISSKLIYELGQNTINAREEVLKFFLNQSPIWLITSKESVLIFLQKMLLRF